MRRPHKFRAVYSVHLHGEELHTDFRVTNTGDAPFDITAALHSYYEVLDIGKARVLGLDGLTYLDKACCPPPPAPGTPLHLNAVAPTATAKFVPGCRHSGEFFSQHALDALLLVNKLTIGPLARVHMPF